MNAGWGSFLTRNVSITWQVQNFLVPWKDAKAKYHGKIRQEGMQQPNEKENTKEIYREIMKLETTRELNS